MKTFQGTHLRVLQAVLAAMMLCVCARAQSPATDSNDVKQQIEALRQEMHREIDSLREEMKGKDAEIARLKAEVEKSHTPADSAPAVAPTQQATAQQTSPRPGHEITASTEVSAHPQPPTPSAKEERKVKPVAVAAKTSGPESIRYRGLELRPTGYFAAESVFRSSMMNADINTPFSGTPYPGSGLNHVREWVPSARQSRIGLLATAQFGTTKMLGYIETDFLGVGATSNNNKSNSYALRIRQGFGQATWANGLTLTAGQTWTLLTENAVGTDVRTEVPPQNIDAAQHVGFTWARQPGVRLQGHIGMHGTLAASLEQGQTIFSAVNAPAGFFYGSPGVGGGNNNPGATYTVSPAPDVMAKFAYDKGRSHSEVGGVLRFFTDRYYPAGSAPQNETRVGGGYFASTHLPIAPKLDFGAKVMLGYGVNRYASSELPDVTVKADGRLQPLKGAQGIMRAEFHATRHLDLLAYAGVEYTGRSFERDANGLLVGYAPPTMDNTGCMTERPPAGNSGVLPTAIANCIGATRTVKAGSIGYQYRFYEGPHGRFQTSVIYTRLQRDGWVGLGGAPRAENNMVFTSFRYVLP